MIFLRPWTLSDELTDVPSVFPGGGTAAVRVELCARLLSKKYLLAAEM